MTERRRRATHPAEQPAALDEAAAIEIAARYLATRPRTRWEVERRLRKAQVPEPGLTSALERLTSMGYIDDAAFVRWWAAQRDRHGPRGRRMVEAELRQHGVPRALLEELRGEELSEPGVDGEGLPADEADRAAAALERHLRGAALPSERKALQRIAAYLARRGFAAETVRDTLRRADNHDPDEA